MRLPRVHGLELEDLGFCPNWLRDEATLVLVRGISLSRWPKSVARVWSPWLRDLGSPRIVDCCSGASGPWPGILQQLPLKVTFTDRYPNLSAWDRIAQSYPGQVDYEVRPVDARCLPADFRGCWSFFNSFHHFAPDDAQKVVEEAVHRGQPLAVFEVVDRHPLRMLAVILMPLVALLSGLWIRPFCWRRIVFTYLVPLIPLLLLWDGWMSCFRVYSREDWHRMISRADPDGLYRWEFGSMPMGWFPMACPYVWGAPRESAMFAARLDEA